MLTDERIDEIVRRVSPELFNSKLDYLPTFRAIEAEVRAEDCRSQSTESERQDSLSLTGATQVRAEARDLVAFPIPPAGIIAHPNLGELYDRLQMQQYAMKYAMLHAAAPTLCLDEYERGKEDGWEACETCHGIVDGGHLRAAALQAKINEQSAEIERLESESEEYAQLQSRCFEGYASCSDGIFDYLKQQAERIAELEQQQETATAMLQSACLKDVARDKKIAQQAALIEKCEKDSLSMAKWIANSGISPGRRRDHACEQCVPGGEMVVPGFVCGYHVALAAIAAQKGGAA